MRTFTEYEEFKSNLIGEINTSKHHCYGMFINGYVYDFDIDDTIENTGELELIYKNGNRKSISLNRDEIEDAKKFLNYLKQKKVLIIPKKEVIETVNLIDKRNTYVINHLSEYVFISDDTYKNVSWRTRETLNKLCHKCKNGYFIEKRYLQNRDLSNIEYRDLTEEDII